MFATMSDAHAEWHRNAGVPMGQPGCPQDACHLPDPWCWECGDEDPACPACRCTCGCHDQGGPSRTLTGRDDVSGELCCACPVDPHRGNYPDPWDPATAVIPF